MDVSVTLGSDIVYVYGTVNEAVAVWVSNGAGSWSATVPRADDCEYRVEVDAYDALGNFDHLSAVLNYGLLLVYNRKQADVDIVTQLAKKNWKNFTDTEKAAWLGGLKGAYNSTDINRVEEAMRVIADLATEYGTNVQLVTRSNWAIADIPSPADMEDYLGKVQKLRETLAPWIEDTLPETMERLTYRGANEIERVLWLIYISFSRAISSIWYSGELLCGEL